MNIENLEMLRNSLIEIKTTTGISCCINNKPAFCVLEVAMWLTQIMEPSPECYNSDTDKLNYEQYVCEVFNFSIESIAYEWIFSQWWRYTDNSIQGMIYRVNMIIQQEVIKKFNECEYTLDRNLWLTEHNIDIPN
jgi:hypothetical protein